MNLIICDDEQRFLDILEAMIYDWAKQKMYDNTLIVHRFTSSKDVLRAWKDGMQIDALLLDIQIPGEMSGLKLAKEIHAQNEYLPVAFITDYGEYAEEGYTVNALRYLRKPVTRRTLFECLDLFWHYRTIRDAQSIVLNLPTQYLRLPLDAILYIEVQGHYCNVHTTDQKGIYRVRKAFGDIKASLQNGIFAQCHRSFIVNIKYIRRITNGEVILVNQESIPISRTHHSSFLRLVRQYYQGVERR